MKRHIIILTSICAVAVSCNQEQPLPDLSDCLVAKSEQHQLDTKTTLYDGNKVVWSEGDIIRVFDVTKTGDASYTGSEFTLNPADAGQDEGRFSGGEIDPSAYSSYRAVYPSDYVTGFTGGKVLMNLPPEQYYGEDSFQSGANVSASTTCTDGTLQFKNACGLLAVNVSGAESYSTITLTTNGNEALWGEGEIDLSAGVTDPVLVMTGDVTAERKSLTLYCAPDAAESKDGQFVEVGSAVDQDGDFLTGDGVSDKTFYFVVPVNTLSEGFTVTINGRSGRFMQKYAGAHSENRIARSVCVAMPNVEFADESEVVIRTDVQNKAFYKDLFNDDGVGVAPNRSNLNVFVELGSRGYTYEYVECTTKNEYVSSLASVNEKARNAMLKYYVGCEYDSNGYLLYPDGEPRFKLFYVNGGYENTHAAAWTAQGRENIRTFFYNGGCYTGNCCGALLSTYRNQPGWTHSGQTPVTMTTGIWPGYPKGMSGNFSTHFDVPAESPLWAYDDWVFEGKKFDGHVDSVRHANGPFFPDPDQVPGTEVLGVYSEASRSGYGNPCSIAYKPSEYSGRLAICGSHPETTPGSECLWFMTAMFRYAMDGVGIAKVKGILHNGEVRSMTKSTEDQDPAFTKVGDKQCHHFAFALPSGARNIKVRMESLEGFNISLRMAQGTFAFKEDAEYAVENSDSVKELTFDTLPKGTWYVGVQCEDVPETGKDEYGIIYTGNTAVLNGAPYKISVTWDLGSKSNK